LKNSFHHKWSPSLEREVTGEYKSYPLLNRI